MVYCIVVGSTSKSGKNRLSFHTIPKIVSNQGEEHEELTRERRRRWISASVEGIQRRRESSTVNEYVGYILSLEKLQPPGIDITSTGCQL